MDNIKTWTGLSVEESIRMTGRINGESTSMVWPTLGSRKAKTEQNREAHRGQLTVMLPLAFVLRPWRTKILVLGPVLGLQGQVLCPGLELCPYPCLTSLSSDRKNESENLTIIKCNRFSTGIILTSTSWSSCCGLAVNPLRPGLRKICWTDAILPVAHVVTQSLRFCWYMPTMLSTKQTGILLKF